MNECQYRRLKVKRRKKEHLVFFYFVAIDNFESFDSGNFKAILNAVIEHSLAIVIMIMEKSCSFDAGKFNGAKPFVPQPCMAKAIHRCTASFSI